MNGQQILDGTAPFFDWLARWYDGLKPAAFADVMPDPALGALLAADLVVGFCRSGPLASARIDAVVAPTVELFQLGYERGVTRFLLAQDTHDPATPEFEAWPVHCVRGTEEAHMVPELEQLPFAGLFTVLEKNALSAGMGTDFESWLARNDDVTDYLVTGDCTDLCTYSLAMFVRMWANASNRPNRRVTVDAAAVQTYDLPVAAAGGGFPHPGDFIHMFFLYHLALNGVRVVHSIQP